MEGITALSVAIQGANLGGLQHSVPHDLADTASLSGSQPTGQASTNGVGGAESWHAVEFADRTAGGNLDLMTPDVRRGVLSNPEMLAEKFGDLLNRFHSDSMAANRISSQMTERTGFGDQASEVALVTPGAEAGPAGSSIAAGIEEQTARSIDLIVDMFEFAVETQLVAKSGTQFTSSLNTLLKGQ